MNLKWKFLIILVFSLCLTISVVSANDANITDIVELDNANETELAESVEVVENISSVDETELVESVEVVENISSVDRDAEVLATGENTIDSSLKTNSTNDKVTPKITLSSTKIRIKDSLEISLKDSAGKPLKYKKLTASINNKKHSLKTNSRGVATLAINLPSKYYKLSVSFNGDKYCNNASKNFTIKALKIKTMIVPLNNFAVKRGHIYIYLYSSDLDKISGKKLIINFKGKKYIKKTNKKGFVKLKIPISKSKCNVKVNFKGDDVYKSSSKRFKVHVIKSMSFNIGNSKLLTKGFLRIYLQNFTKR